jgi:hypothetical protein
MKKTIKSQILDFIQFECGGRATRKQILTFILKLKGINEKPDAATLREFRGYYASYFSDPSWGGNSWGFYNKAAAKPNPGGLLMKPTESDKRFIIRKSRGNYVLSISAI